MTLTAPAAAADPDAIYQAIIAMHDGLSVEESHKANVKLVLILASQIGDLETVKEATRIARGAVSSQPDNQDGA
ncbi:MAG: DUF2783 domain-containing protein [Pseudomonadota bacterium]